MKPLTVKQLENALDLHDVYVSCGTKKAGLVSVFNRVASLVAEYGIQPEPTPRHPKKVKPPMEYHQLQTILKQLRTEKKIASSVRLNQSHERLYKVYQDYLDSLVVFETSGLDDLDNCDFDESLNTGSMFDVLSEQAYMDMMSFN